MKKIAIIILLLAGASCKKEEQETPLKNVFYEVAGPGAYRVEIVDENSQVIIFDSVTLGWNWQKRIAAGNFIAIESKKINLLDSNTIDVVRLYINMELKKEVIDTGKTKTLAIWSKI